MLESTSLPWLTKWLMVKSLQHLKCFCVKDAKVHFGCLDFAGIDAGVKPIINLKVLHKLSILPLRREICSIWILILQGYLVGNGCTDDVYDGNALVPFAHGMALISDELFEVSILRCSRARACVLMLLRNSQFVLSSAGNYFWMQRYLLQPDEPELWEQSCQSRQSKFSPTHTFGKCTCVFRRYVHYLRIVSGNQGSKHLRHSWAVLSLSIEHYSAQGHQLALEL